MLLIACRKARLMSHNTMKWRLQRLWQQAVRDDGGRAVAAFVATLQPFIQPALRGLLAGISAGQGDAVLATAAAGDYAVPLGKMLGFTHVLATDPDRGPDSESNVMTHKRDAVFRLLADQGWMDRERVLFTDHRDDLPLMAVCQTVYWFGTSAAGHQVEAELPRLRLRDGTKIDCLTGPQVVTQVAGE
jgi:phosphoserine phosphatase